MILNNSKPCVPIVDAHQYHTIVMSGDVDNLTPTVVIPKSIGIPFTEFSLENMQRAGVPLRPLDMSPITGSDSAELLDKFANSLVLSKPQN